MNMTGMHNMHSNHTTDMHSNHTTDMHSNHTTDMHSNHTTDMHSNHTTDMHSNHTTDMHSNHSTHMDHGNEEHGNQHLLHDTSHNMYFHTGVSEYILFQDLYTSSKSGMIGACLAIFAVAVLYEGLKFLREELLKRTLSDKKAVYSVKELDKSLNNGNQCLEVSSRMCSWAHLLQVFLHICQVFISYCLMLVFMTFNLWLTLAVLLGAGLGHFLFGWKRTLAVDVNEHCH